VHIVLQVLLLLLLLAITRKDTRTLQRLALTVLTSSRTGSPVEEAQHQASMVMAVQQVQVASGGWLAW
jgi:hypothetical protein